MTIACFIALIRHYQTRQHNASLSTDEHRRSKRPLARTALLCSPQGNHSTNCAFVIEKQPTSIAIGWSEPVPGPGVASAEVQRLFTAHCSNYRSGSPLVLLLELCHRQPRGIFIKVFELHRPRKKCFDPGVGVFQAVTFLPENPRVAPAVYVGGRNIQQLDEPVFFGALQ